MAKWKLKSARKAMAAGAWMTVFFLLGSCAGKKGPDQSLEPPSMTASINAVKVESDDSQDRVLIQSEPAVPTYNVYKWADPVRVVVDIPEASLGQVPELIPVADGVIQEVEVKTVASDQNPDKSMVRVIINLAKSLEYEVEREENGLAVAVKKEQGQLAETDLFPETKTMVLVDKGETLEPVSASEDWAWSGPEVSPPPMAAETDLAKAESPARNLLEIQVEKDSQLLRVKLIADGRIGDYSAFTLENPARLVVDLWGLRNKTGLLKKDINLQGILRVRAGQHPDKLRLVFDGSASLPQFRFDKEGNVLVVTFSKAMDLSASPEISEAAAVETAGSSPESSPAEEWELPELAQAGSQEEWTGPSGPAPATPAEPQPAVSAPPLEWPAVAPPAKEEKKGIAYISSVKFEYSESASTISITADRPIRRDTWTREDNPDEKIVSFFIREAQVAADQQRSYDTTEFQSPIELFSVFQRPDRQNEVGIVVVMRNWAASKWVQKGNRLEFQFENYPGSLGLAGQPTTGMFGPKGEEITGAEETLIMRPGEEVVTPEEKVKYTGATISLDFKNMDILDALRTIAEVSGMNIVVDEKVKGRITIKLDNVPWDQALDLILETKGLGKVEKGNIIRIAPKSVIIKEKAELQAAAEAEEKYTPLVTKVIPVSYLQAQDLKRIIKPLLTKGRGQVDTEKRQNSLVVRDIPSVVEDVYKLVSTLDRPTKQVLIEARIVEATVGVTRTIGVNWSVGADIGPQTGISTGLDFPNSIGVGGAVLGGLGAGTGAASANILSLGGGAVGISVGHLTNAINLDLALRALEAQEKIKIISSPRILTLSDEKAEIEQGITIPYPPASFSTQGWTFIRAALELSVTPHITADNSIILDVTASNNEPVTIPDSAYPGIQKKEARTTIMLKDGETAVLGGVFKIRITNPRTQVPFLGNLPIIGHLFKQSIDEKRNEELIIFLTPQIIEPGRGKGTPTLAGMVMGAER